ncbi:MAG: FHA domain-containing protein [Chloroflexi bacterium]|nr:FHA domain-containing protein [Chloroflexota bacterium]MCI0579054.1 FHA domain-containing protein [Chloroflexota bacterium]MCI0644459.1 FHA domain-containing protein [Chloroflexota bacterium]MCI0725847.1 FHA domain-containing protein [Chloroflexota bacterium]
MNETVLEDAQYVRLLWDDPSTGEPREQIEPLPVTIGRSESNSLMLSSDRVSRQHARLEVENDQVIVVDLQSSNGTFVNHERVTRQTVQDGDVLRIGPFLITIDTEPLQQEAPVLPQLSLRWTEPGSGQSRDVTAAPPITLGRDPGNTVVLVGEKISRHHAVVEAAGDGFVIKDNNSANGVYVNGVRQKEAPLQPGDTLRIGDFTITVRAPVTAATIMEAAPDSTRLDASSQATLIFSADSDALLPLVQAAAPRRPEFPPAIFALDQVPVAELKKSGLPLDETTYLAVGGGLGSFAWVDHLVIFGADPAQVMAIGLESKPHGRYERLCRNSQIPPHERLRSDSGSTPDNIWGWPGYAVREIWGSLLHGRVIHAGQMAWRIFGEPALDQTYTPRSGDVFAAIDREAARIGWGRISRLGHVKAIRKTDDGRYVVAYSQSGKDGYRQCLALARYVHIGVGYPGVRFLPDLQKYREETGDFKSVVNAYEEHEHAYEHLRKEGGTVLIRGRGIVASRIVQRLYELRQQNPNINVLHLMRTPLVTGNRFGWSRRLVHNHWEFQPFNWPKACWTGEYLTMLDRANDQQRERLLNDWGGTTTADRRDWRRMVAEGLREEWYQIRFGAVREVARDEDGQLVTIIRGGGKLEEELRLVADYIIDCTGMEASIDTNPLLKDLLEHHRLEKNVKGRLRVASDFEIVGMRNEPGRIYANGVMTLGGPLAAVDSFLGLQYAAQRSVDSLAKGRAPGLRYLNGLRSVYQWLRWARGVAP